MQPVIKSKRGNGFKKFKEVIVSHSHRPEPHGDDTRTISAEHVLATETSIWRPLLETPENIDGCLHNYLDECLPHKLATVCETERLCVCEGS